MESRHVLPLYRDSYGSLLNPHQLAPSYLANPIEENATSDLKPPTVCGKYEVGENGIFESEECCKPGYAKGNPEPYRFHVYADISQKCRIQRQIADTAEYQSTYGVAQA